MSKEDLFKNLSPAKSESDTLLLQRFACVRDALILAIGAKQPGVEVKQSTRDWSGSDQGIRDHRMLIHGCLNGIDLVATINGSTYEQPYFVKGKRGVPKLSLKKVENWEINCNFVLPNRMKGALVVSTGDTGETLEAYWQQDIGGGFRLGQIIVNGRVYDADKLNKDNFGNVIVPETEIRVPYFKN